MIYAIILFIIGFLFLLFAPTKKPEYDILGFVLTTIAFVWALII